MFCILISQTDSGVSGIEDVVSYPTPNVPPPEEVPGPLHPDFLPHKYRNTIPSLTRQTFKYSVLIWLRDVQPYAMPQTRKTYTLNINAQHVIFVCLWPPVLFQQGREKSTRASRKGTRSGTGSGSTGKTVSFSRRKRTLLARHSRDRGNLKTYISRREDTNYLVTKDGDVTHVPGQAVTRGHCPHRLKEKVSYSRRETLPLYRRNYTISLSFSSLSYKNRYLGDLTRLKRFSQGGTQDLRGWVTVKLFSNKRGNQWSNDILIDFGHCHHTTSVEKDRVLVR